MKIAKICAVVTLLLVIYAVRPTSGAAVGSNAAIPPQSTIFVADYSHVTAYPATGRGNIPPIALDTDMVAPSGLARDASGRLYVTNSDTNTITVYAANSNGNVPPIAVIGGSNTGLENPGAIALDASGKVYVVSSGRYPRGFIAVYPPLGTSTGILNEAPITVIAGPKTLLKGPDGLALDANGNLYVANGLGGPIVRHEPADRGRITVYAAGSSGNVPPIITITGAATGLSFPSGIALDANGDIYVANAGTANTKSHLPSITVYAAGSSGNVSPVAIIAGGNTGLIYSSNIALDSSGNLYALGIASSGTYSVNVYPPGSNGDVSPAASIAGKATGLSGSIGIVLDSNGNLYVLNYGGGPLGNGSITAYASGSVGDIPPIATISSNFTGLGFTSGLALDSRASLYVADEFSGPGAVGSVEIYPPATYAIGPSAATIAGAHTALQNPLGVALDPRDNIAVLNGDNVITEYPAGSIGDATPNASLTIDSKGKNVPIAIALGAGGKVYVANQPGVNCNWLSCYQTGAPNVAIYAAGSHGNAKPSAVIRGHNTGLGSPSAIAVAARGAIYVTNQGPMKCGTFCSPVGPGSITVYAPDSNGDVAPIRTISGAHTKLGAPHGIALDSNGNIYVLNATGFFGASARFDVHYGSVPSANFLSNFAGAGTHAIRGPILIFAAGSDGDVAPIGAIGGPLTALNPFPAGIAVGPAGP